MSWRRRRRERERERGICHSCRLLSNHHPDESATMRVSEGKSSECIALQVLQKVCRGKENDEDEGEDGR